MRRWWLEHWTIFILHLHSFVTVIDRMWAVMDRHWLLKHPSLQMWPGTWQGLSNSNNKNLRPETTQSPKLSWAAKEPVCCCRRCCSAAERGTGSPAPPDVCPLHTDHLSADPPAAELLVLQHVSLPTQGPDLDRHCFILQLYFTLYSFTAWHSSMISSLYRYDETLL